MPKNQKIVDWKPKNSIVIDWKPKNVSTKMKETTDQLYEVTLAVGSPMGLLLGLTYPTTITVISSYSP
jgi:hypothetical protein